MTGLLFWAGVGYFLAAHGSGLLLHAAAWCGVRRVEQGSVLAELPHVHADMEAPVSLILAAHDDAAGVVASVQALLALHYPTFEIIVVNDGSCDDKMQALCDAFELLPFPEAYRIQLTTQPVAQIYRSMRHLNLRVLNKAVGGRADAWNAGINAARYPLICALDCNTALHRDGLHRLALPFVGSADTIASSGVLDGPAAAGSSWCARIGFVASLRTKLFAPFGWATLNAMLVAPSGIQLLRKDAVLRAGGYAIDAREPDVDMIPRLHRAACARQQPYRISLVGETVGKRRRGAAATARAQCRATQQTLLDVASRHGALLWRRHTGLPLRLASLWLLLFACLGPVIETASYAGIAAAGLSGHMQPLACAAFFAIAIGWGVLLSISGLLLDAVSFRNAHRVDEPGKLLIAAAMENLGYRQLHAFWRTLGLITWLRNKAGSRHGVTS